MIATRLSLLTSLLILASCGSRSSEAFSESHFLAAQYDLAIADVEEESCIEVYVGAGSTPLTTFDPICPITDLSAVARLAGQPNLVRSDVLSNILTSSTSSVPVSTALGGGSLNQQQPGKNTTLDQRPTTFQGLDIDALSFAQDWIPIRWDVPDGEWRMIDLGSPDEPCPNSPGWALLTFTDSDGLLGLGWGSKLNASGILPATATTVASLDGTSLITFAGPGFGVVDALDLNNWNVLAPIATTGTCTPPPIPPGDPAWGSTGSNRYKIYFSVRGTEDSLNALEERVTASDKTIAGWRSGATIFSLEIVADAEGAGTTILGPRVEIPSSTMLAAGIGIQPGEDIDALAIDPATGVAIVSVDGDRGPNGDPFLAMAIGIVPPAFDDRAKVPTPLKTRNGVRLGGVRPRIQPRTTCGHDPRWLSCRLPDPQPRHRPDPRQRQADEASASKSPKD